MSTDLPLAASLNDSKPPSTSSSAMLELEANSFDNEDCVDSAVVGSCDAGTEVVAGVVVARDVVVERISVPTETLSSNDED